jgi:xanthine dehydrogenase accessory factor
MNAWIEQLYALLDENEAVVTITVAAVRGSAPREVGAKMIVTSRHSLGTIGGGQLEHECTRIAIGHLRDNTAGARFRRRFPLGADLGQCCGGVVDIQFDRVSRADSNWLDELRDLYLAREALVMVSSTDCKLLVTAGSVTAGGKTTVADAVVAEARGMLRESCCIARSSVHDGKQWLFEPVSDAAMSIAIFGAGHVGSACVAALSRIDCRIRWIDSRRNVFPAKLPAKLMRIDSPNPAQEVAAMPPGTWFLVMTHSHPMDYDICLEVLKRNDSAYCGLIGSKSKRQRFARIVRDCGLPSATMDRLTCPIGVSGISSKRPEDIAVAVVAQLLQQRDAALFAQDHDRGRATLAVVRQHPKSQ